jgi:arylsulfatase A-like enzyme
MKATLVAITMLLAVGACAADVRRPNVVFILADNEGAWQLGCYGNPDIKTPNIDRLAAEGVRFTRSLSSNPVCSPTRATYLTGLIPSQHGVHSYLPTDNLKKPLPYALAEFVTLPRVMHEAGYVCGMAGKWHLGGTFEPRDGFSDWITMPSGHTTEFYDADVIEDGKVRKEPKYLTDLWTEHAVKFIEKNRDRPFFLYLPYNGPYGLGKSLTSPGHNRWVDFYADKPMWSFPREAMHPWQHANKPFLNNMVAIRRVATETSGVDDGVGAVMATLKKLELDENTLVIYAADQGWMGGQNGIWGMGDHLRPVGAFELQMQVPLIFRMPGKVAAGKTCDALVSNYDFLPSVLSFLGLKDKVGTKPGSPGRDYSPALVGKKLEWDNAQNAIYYEMEQVRAIRGEGWKYVKRQEGPNELYDMKNDPSEKFNLYGQEKTAETQKEMGARLEKFFGEYVDPQYDVWHGGRSKAKRLGQEASIIE